MRLDYTIFHIKNTSDPDVIRKNYIKGVTDSDLFSDEFKERIKDGSNVTVKEVLNVKTITEVCNLDARVYYDESIKTVSGYKVSDSGSASPEYKTVTKHREVTLNLGSDDWGHVYLHFDKGLHETSKGLETMDLTDIEPHLSRELHAELTKKVKSRENVDDVYSWEKYAIESKIRDLIEKNSENSISRVEVVQWKDFDFRDWYFVSTAYEISVDGVKYGETATETVAISEKSGKLSDKVVKLNKNNKIIILTTAVLSALFFVLFGIVNPILGWSKMFYLHLIIPVVALAISFLVYRPTKNKAATKKTKQNAMKINCMVLAAEFVAEILIFILNC